PIRTHRANTPRRCTRPRGCCERWRRARMREHREEAERDAKAPRRQERQEDKEESTGAESAVAPGRPVRIGSRLRPALAGFWSHLAFPILPPFAPAPSHCKERSMTWRCCVAGLVLLGWTATLPAAAPPPVSAEWALVPADAKVIVSVRPNKL